MEVWWIWKMQLNILNESSWNWPAWNEQNEHSGCTLGPRRMIVARPSHPLLPLLLSASTLGAHWHAPSWTNILHILHILLIVFQKALWNDLHQGRLERIGAGWVHQLVLCQLRICYPSVTDWKCLRIVVILSYAVPLFVSCLAKNGLIEDPVRPTSTQSSQVPSFLADAQLHSKLQTEAPS